ncbi:hypothetical protein [Nitrospira calida]|jgi:hypothetical protein
MVYEIDHIVVTDDGHESERLAVVESDWEAVDVALLWAWAQGRAIDPSQVVCVADAALIEPLSVRVAPRRQPYARVGLPS